MNFLISLRSELLKTRRTWVIYLCILAAALIPVLSFLFDNETADGIAELKKDPWNKFLKNGLEMIGLVLLPAYILFASTLMAQLEYRNGTWKQVFTSPQKLLTIFMAKFFAAQLFIIAFIILHNLLMILSLISIDLFHADLNLWSRSLNWSSFLTYTGNLYVAVLGISAIQLWLGMRFKSFLVPVGFGFAMWFASMMLTFEYKSLHVDKFPFAYPLMIIMPRPAYDLQIVLWRSLGYAGLFLLIGFLDFRRRKFKSS